MLIKFFKSTGENNELSLRDCGRICELFFKIEFDTYRT